MTMSMPMMVWALLKSWRVTCQLREHRCVSRCLGTYLASAMSDSDANRQRGQNQAVHKALERAVNRRRPEQRHGHGAGGEEDAKRDHHDGRVGQEHPALFTTGLHLAGAAVAAAAAAVTGRASAAGGRDAAVRLGDEGVAVRCDGGLGGVDLELDGRVVLGDAGALARGRERGAALPGADPVVGAVQREGARAPLDAVRADEVGDHVAVAGDAAAGQELQLGGVAAGVEAGREVAAAVTGGERHVSGAVLVGDKHVGPGHA